MRAQGGWRKFAIAVYFGTGVFALCFTGHITSGDCTLCVATLAGLFKAANVLDKKFGGAG